MRRITDKCDAGVAPASFLNAKQQPGQTAHAIFGQARNVNAIGAHDAQALVGGVPRRAGWAIEQEKMRGGREHAARSGHMAVAADD